MKKAITVALLICTVLSYSQVKTKGVNLYPDVVVKSEKINAKGENVLVDNIQLIDINTGKISIRDVLIESKKIVKISKKIRIDEKYKVINGEGKWMIPGLIDSHIHLFQSGGLYTRPDVANLNKFKAYEEERQWLKRNAADFLKRYLKCGITTVIDVGGPIYNFDLRDKYSDVSEFPNLYITGPLVSTYQPKAFEIENAPIIKVNTPEEAIELVKKQVPLKPDFIKIWYIVRSKDDETKNYEIVKATIDEAHKNNLKVAVHATQLATAKKAIKAGANFLVHSVENEKIDDEFIKMVKESNVSYIPTLIVMKNYVKSFSQDITPSKEDFNISNPTALGSLYDSKTLEMRNLPYWKRYKEYVKNNQKKLDNDKMIMAYNLKKAVDNGFNVATGTDAGNIGTLHATSFFDEMMAMKNAGLTNLQILQASTLNGAKVLNKENELGSIEEGKLADIVILNSNPIENLEAVKDIDYVVKGGTVYPIDGVIKDTPEQLVQRQVNGYNARNIEAFLEPYSEDFEIYNYPNTLRGKGKSNSKLRYKKLFEMYPNLHCEIVKRMVLGNKVIDYERITGVSEKPIEAIAIYEIENNKIKKVTFVK